VLFRSVLKKSGWKRSDLIVSTKIFWGGPGPNDSGLSRKHVIEGTKAALARLQLDYVDLLYCHRPDPDTPIEETVRAMSNLVNSGYAFYWGTSEWSAAEIVMAHHIARRERLVPPTMEQPQYNMLARDRVEKEYCPLYGGEYGMGLTTFSPLASGVLTGKYNGGIKGVEGRLNLKGYEWLKSRFEGEEGGRKIGTVKKLAGMAGDLGCSMAQLALAWCLKNPSVSSVITGASRPEQVTDNMKALETAQKLTPPVMEKIEGILENKPEPPQKLR
jgi:voltage-dependent potassium channel beta subunit